MIKSSTFWFVWLVAFVLWIIQSAIDEEECHTLDKTAQMNGSLCVSKDGHIVQLTHHVSK